MKKLFALMMVAALAAIGCDDKKSTPKAGTQPTMNPQRTTEPPHTTTTPEPARTTTPGAATTTKPKESAPVLPPKGDDKDKKDGKDGGK